MAITDLKQTDFDVAIIGGGPAGLSAGTWLARFLHDVVVVDSGDPRNWKTEGVHGFLGHEGVRPARLRREGRKTCRKYGAHLLDDHVHSVERRGSEDFSFQTDADHQFRARRVLIAIGIRDNWPDIPGLDRCYGTTVHTCPNCDGFESKDTPTAVIGAGSKAASVALALTTWTDEILICTNGLQPAFDPPSLDTLDRLGIEIIEKPIVMLEEKQRRLRSIDFDDGQTARCEHLFIAMGQKPHDDIGDQLGCDRNDMGFICVDSHHHTSVYNVFAAGDITPGAQLAIRSAAGGAEAALSIHHSLIPEHRRVHRSC